VSTLAFGIGSFAIAIVMSSGGMISKSHYRPHGLQEVETVLGALLLVANLFSF
jgi:VIT1/CCC1 family predicted Fe2+/Mn2+ transporter